MKRKPNSPPALPVVATPVNVPARPAKQALNPTRHGLDAKTLILAHVGETVRGYNRHLRETVASLGAAGYIEEQLAIQYADALWRLNRVRRYRTVAARLVHDQRFISAGTAIAEGRDGVTPEMMTALAELGDVRRSRRADKAEAHAMRVLRNSLAMLHAEQRRRGARVIDEAEVEKSRNEHGAETVRERKRRRIIRDAEDVG